MCNISTNGYQGSYNSSFVLGICICYLLLCTCVWCIHPCVHRWVVILAMLTLGILLYPCPFYSSRQAFSLNLKSVLLFCRLADQQAPRSQLSLTHPELSYRQITPSLSLTRALRSEIRFPRLHGKHFTSRAIPQPHELCWLDE